MEGLVNAFIPCALKPTANLNELALALELYSIIPGWDGNELRFIVETA